jgi:hypothetical protein
MDTAQRGMGVDWATALELIQRTMEAARAHPLKPRVACGAGTDHKAPGRSDRRRRDHRRLCRADGGDRGRGRADHPDGDARLPAIGADAETYATVYDTLLSQAAEPVILHWLGEMFDPALAGYWGTRDVAAASDIVLGLIERNAAKIDGIKISLLDQEHERRSAPGCRRGCGSIQATISTMRR